MIKNQLLIAAFFLFATPLMAQQKYGHINSHEVLISMPEYKLLTAALEKKQKSQEAKLQSMYADYQKQAKDLSDYGDGLMEAVREEKMMDLDSLKQAITDFQQSGQEELQEYQAKLLKPLNDKYLKIVGEVAKENGYSYIFDITTGALAYYPEKAGDITGLVKKKMGITQ